MLALEVGPGDEVIMPSFTFVSSANSVVLRGAQVVFAEVDPVTLNLDPDDVEKRVTKRTKAVMPVHYAGVGCDMHAFAELSQKHGIRIVEDAAQAVDSQNGGRFLGTIGDIGCYSFHGTKNITCGEGGAFITNDDKIAERAEILAEKGTNRSAFLRGQVDKYSWVGCGSSCILSDILAAVLEVQLKKRQEIKQRRRVVWEAYAAALQALAEEHRIVLPHVPDECDHNYHIFYFRVASRDERDQLLKALQAEGIGATFHFVPLHSSSYGRTSLKNDQQLPITDRCSDTVIRLPLYPGLADQVDSLIDATPTTIGSMMSARKGA